MRLTNISNEFLLRQVVLVTGFFAVVTFALIHSFSPGLNQYLVPVVTAVSSIVCVLTCVKKPQEVKSR